MLAEAPPKPAVGAPCNGCGVCCLAEPCPVGIVVTGRRSGACAALEFSEVEGRYRCGVLEAPDRALEARFPRLARWAGTARGGAITRALGRRFVAAGTGCDSDVEVEPGADGDEG